MLTFEVLLSEKEPCIVVIVVYGCGQQTQTFNCVFGEVLSEHICFSELVLCVAVALVSSNCKPLVMLFFVKHTLVEISLAYYVCSDVRLAVLVIFGQQLDAFAGVLGYMLAFDVLLPEKELCCGIALLYCFFKPNQTFICIFINAVTCDVCFSKLVLRTAVLVFGGELKILCRPCRLRLCSFAVQIHLAYLVSDVVIGLLLFKSNQTCEGATVVIACFGDVLWHIFSPFVHLCDCVCGERLSFSGGG